MNKDKKNKINLLANSVNNNVDTVKISGTVYKTDTRGSIEKVEIKKSIQTLEKALQEGVFSDLKKDDQEDK